MADTQHANAGRPTGVRVSTDPADIDLEWLHPALSERAYWALGRTREQLTAAIARSLTFAAFEGDRQVGFARVITDGVTFGWVCDVFVDEAERGRGVGDLLMATIAADPRLAGLRRLVLATKDAHGLYERHGFGPLVHPDRWMERQRASGTAKAR
jgi:GNAT superfamily N-acetyltransferase